MENIDLNQFVEWQKDHPRCPVSIKIENNAGDQEISIWVYSYDLGVGRYVTSAAEIDLEGAKDADDQAAFKRLKARFEGGQHD